ncbi:type II toxin-antitoxin system RelE/ParE family toxin [bacterium]|nr:type II toxin-antitoxin system RelE/ParE family toxin [bacterium]
MKLSIREEAVADAVYIRTWLLDRSPRAAARFDAQLAQSMRLVIEHPDAGHIYLHGYRRALFFGGRYMII